MKIIQIFAVNQQVKHVVTLAANLKTSLNPVNSGGLEKFGRFKGSEKVSLLLRFRTTMVKSV